MYIKTHFSVSLPPQSRWRVVVCVSTPRMYPRSGCFLLRKKSFALNIVYKVRSGANIFEFWSKLFLSLLSAYWYQVQDLFGVLAFHSDISEIQSFFLHPNGQFERNPRYLVTPLIEGFQNMGFFIFQRQSLMPKNYSISMKIISLSEKLKNQLWLGTFLISVILKNL